MATSSLVQQRKVPQKLFCDQDRYFLVLDTMYKLINYHELQKQQMLKDFDSHVIDVLSKRIGDTLDEQPLLALGVGSNEGKKQQTA